MTTITATMFAQVADGPADNSLFAELWPNGFAITVENFEIAVDHELGENFMALLTVGQPAHIRWQADEDQTIETAVAILNEQFA